MTSDKPKSLSDFVEEGSSSSKSPSLEVFVDRKLKCVMIYRPDIGDQVGFNLNSAMKLRSLLDSAIIKLQDLEDE